jgi:hypothetical protein
MVILNPDFSMKRYLAWHGLDIASLFLRPRRLSSWATTRVIARDEGPLQMASKVLFLSALTVLDQKIKPESLGLEIVLDRP